MKILLVNNYEDHSQRIRQIERELEGHELQIQQYQPGVELNTAGMDLVILSGGGGEGREAGDFTKPGHLWYQDEMDFILSSNVPILGICMGFELIAQAYGSKVEKLKKSIDGWRKLKVNAANPWGLRALKQFERHDFSVHKISGDFEVLASSQTGVEIIKHRKRPILATQFHPEVGGTLSLKQLVEALV